MGILLVLSACGKIGKQGKGPDNRPAEREGYYFLSDMTESLDWLGKSTEELGIDKQYIYENKMVPLDGILWEDNLPLAKADLESKDGKLIVTRVVIGTDKDYDACKDILIKKYGQPVEEGTRPYTASSKGESMTVCYCIFHIDHGTLELHQTEGYGKTQLKTTYE